MSHYFLSSFIVAVIATGANAAAPAKLHFNRDIRPLMSDTCFHCHGPDKNTRKAGLRLDIREEALKPAKSGELPIVPGKPEESEIIKRLFTRDTDDLMPPEEAHKTFTPEQKETFKRWVAEGAEYEPHWAYTPLTRPAVPKCNGPVSSFKGSDAVDAFIQEKLAEKNVEPSARADARTLIRRLSLDLKGLPPTPAEVEAFVKDSASNPNGTLEKAVDRLLESPHYGERMAVWWLDVARFTDTVGFHGDQNQRIFPYRDYVIDAFSKNKRFDQFTLEQLAGDLLPNPTPEQLVATGFNRLNMVTREGGAQPKEYLAKYGAERVRTVGGAWLGATLGCCECHDHKFDPFTARDFYSMQAYFADVKQWGVYADYGYTPNPELKGVNNEYPFPPEIQVDSPYLKQRSAQIREKLTSIALQASRDSGKDPQAKVAFESWKKAGLSFLKANPSGWATPKPEVKVAVATPVKAKGGPKEKKPAAKAKVAPEPESFTVLDDGRIVFASKAADNTSIILLPEAGWVSAVRVELLPDEAHKGSILRSNGEGAATLKLTASLQTSSGKKALPVAFRHADANLKEVRYSSGADIIGIKDAWKTDSKAWNKKHVAVCLLDKPIKIGSGDKLTIQIADNTAGCVRVSVSPFATPDPRDDSSVASVGKLLSSQDGASSPAVQEAYLTSTGWNAEALKSYAAEYSSLLECRDGKAWTMVTQSVKEPLTVRVLPRGNWMDETGALVQPDSPLFLKASKLADKKGSSSPRSTRLDLAKWLCSNENPLTPRAFVNRLWKQFFGNGLSIIVDDLGAQGEPPSHPELLDWLAMEFRESGWDVKHMIKLLVLSNTYLQNSSLRRELADVDPNNRLLASQNPRRLDAEFVRDNALAISGLLNSDIGGPSVKPYQPGGYYVNLQFPSRDYVASADDRQWRRGVYMHWQRTFLHPMLANFDAPMRDECTANRPGSNTPQQALTLLNDPTFVEAARSLAGRVLTSQAKDDQARLRQAYELALGRGVKDKEMPSLLALLQSQRELVKTDKAEAQKLLHIGLSPACATCDAAELAAWTTICRVVLNLHETITRY